MYRFDGLQTFIQHLERIGQLKRIQTYVDPVLEITEITDRVVKHQGPALLFERTGTNFPLLINAFGSYERMALALHVKKDWNEIHERLQALFSSLQAPKQSFLDKLKALPVLGQVSKWFPKVQRGTAKCQEVVHLEPRLSMLPIMQCWPHDGGRYITLPLVHTYHPETKQRNVGMYRIQVLDEQRLIMHWQLHKTGRMHFELYRKRRKKMPIAIALGGDPVYTYVATAPLPPNVDEYLFAGFLRNRPVVLVPCITQPIEVPADADIVIEGYIDPEEPFAKEGPFGDHTGFYSLPDDYPVVHVTAITHRKDAVYPSTIVGIPPQEDAFLGKATERIFLTPIQLTLLPELIDMNLPIHGVFHNLALLKIQNEFPGHAYKVMNALWGAGQMMFTKVMVVVDEQAPSLETYKDLVHYAMQHFDPRNDVLFSKGPLDVLDHACDVMAYGGKLGIDATTKKQNAYPPITAVEIEKLKNLPLLFSEIHWVDCSLAEAHIPILFMGVESMPPQQLKSLLLNLNKEPALLPIKIIVCFDANIPRGNFGDYVWIIGSHIDAVRDVWLMYDDEGFARLFVNAQRKRRSWGFPRPWPEVITMDDATIQLVDKRWKEYSLGTFIPSPSLRYRVMRTNNSAFAKES